ncbi:hypothetical protein [Kluyvera sichuanensis]|uniref:hypothetical protein n=1 Tax=Kluyvera sichuanensis TaxID=2725494 RepID=UPI002FD3C2AE
MSNLIFLKCVKDTEGYWSEGETYPATVVAGGFVQVGDDDAPSGEGWTATQIERWENGTVIYRVGGIEGEVLFEEVAK